VRAVQDRQSAFLAGVAAGTGFAILENVLYASSSGFFGQSWQTVVVARMLGV
ncbi:MAG: PrsW family intramembrane metalloprotease, partial [Gemmatimonadetes bacterium]|nr:PrsW family intramembrane metalloprotease [Gemmatimonadota bacterium]